MVKQNRKRSMPLKGPDGTVLSKKKAKLLAMHDRVQIIRGKISQLSAEGLNQLNNFMLQTLPTIRRVTEPISRQEKQELRAQLTNKPWLSLELIKLMNRKEALEEELLENDSAPETELSLDTVTTQITRLLQLQRQRWVELMASMKYFENCEDLDSKSAARQLPSPLPMVNVSNTNKPSTSQLKPENESSNRLTSTKRRELLMKRQPQKKSTGTGISVIINARLRNEKRLRDENNLLKKQLQQYPNEYPLPYNHPRQQISVPTENHRYHNSRSSPRQQRRMPSGLNFHHQQMEVITHHPHNLHEEYYPSSSMSAYQAPVSMLPHEESVYQRQVHVPPLMNTYQPDFSQHNVEQFCPGRWVPGLQMTQSMNFAGSSDVFPSAKDDQRNQLWSPTNQYNTNSVYRSARFGNYETAQQAANTYPVYNNVSAPTLPPQQNWGNHMRDVFY